MLYPGPPILESKLGLNVIFHNPKVDDIVMAFIMIPRSGEANHVSTKGVFDPNTNQFKVAIGNHFQGICRHRSGRVLYLSGDSSINGSVLFIIEMKSYLKNESSDEMASVGPFGSNVLTKNDDINRDAIIGAFTLDSSLYHAGGMSMMGDVLIVPVEDKSRSKILFIDVSIADSPMLIEGLNVILDRKAGCASCVRLPNDHFLLFSWTEIEGQPNITLHLSVSSELSDGFGPPLLADIDYDNSSFRGRKPRFQSISFVEDEKGKLALIGMDTPNPKGGKDRLFLIDILLHQSTLKSSDPKLVLPNIVITNVRYPIDGRTYYNFNHAGGIYVSKSNHLAVYSSWKSRKGIKEEHIRFSEFWCSPVRGDEPFGENSIAVIELYSEINFQGKSIRIYPFRNNEIINYKNIKNGGGSFGDVAKSLKFFLPKGLSYSFYEDDSFNQKKKRGVYMVDKSRLVYTIYGTDLIELVPDLSQIIPDGLNVKMSMSEMFSSSRITR